jgi:hypothetical protein
MSELARTLGTGFFQLILAIEMLIVAIAILRRRPVVIVPEAIAGAMISLFLPILALVIISFAAGNSPSDFTVSSLVSLILILILLLFVIIVAVSAVLAAQYTWLFNISETMLIDALSTVLQKQGLEYSPGQSPGFRARLSRMSRITVAASEQDSIKVTLGSFGRAWIRFVGKRHNPGRKVVVADLKRLLSTNECGNSILSGFMLLILSIAMIGMFIYSLI